MRADFPRYDVHARAEARGGQPPKRGEASLHTASPSAAPAQERSSAPSPLSDHVRTWMFGKEESAEKATPPALPESKNNHIARLFDTLFGTNALIGQRIPFLSAWAADPVALTAFIQP